uniref:Uncharacterized protein n=1 Tax=Xenopus tropicalis TaxID=8364 RepID=A0A803JLM8_XENTR
MKCSPSQNIQNITNGMTSTSKSCHQNLVVFLSAYLNKIQTTIVWYECSDFLAVFDQLHSDALPDSRVWLAYLHFFQDNSFSMRSTSKWVGLQSGSQMGLLVLLIMPFLLTAVVAELSCCTKTTALA